MSVGTASDLLDWEHISQSQIERTWGQIDHKQIALKAKKISGEIRSAIKTEADRIRHEQRSNDNWMAARHMQVAAELRFTDEWVEKLYTVYCDVWTKQGQTKTPVFIRCVFQKAIEPLIEMRKQNALSWITQELLRTGRRTDTWNAVESSFQSDLTRLAPRWRDKLQIEARECQYVLRRNHMAGDESVRQGNAPINTPTTYVVGTDPPPAEILGRRRAELVARLIQELNALRPNMQVPEDDYPILRDAHPDYEVFKICKNHPGASKWVKLVSDRRRVESLAWALAAAAFGVSAATIETAWKRYKRKPARSK